MLLWCHNRPKQTNAVEQSFEVAQLNIEDVKLVVVFLQQAADGATYAAIERAAEKAGLDGDVVAVWADEFCRTRFFARPERHAFFKAAGYDQLRAQINATLRLD
jgi:hypothetical protein